MDPSWDMLLPSHDITLAAHQPPQNRIQRIQVTGSGDQQTTPEEEENQPWNAGDVWLQKPVQKIKNIL
jgi:hypothetical protein